jgi:molybdate transport system substrate-binding protein
LSRAATRAPFAASAIWLTAGNPVTRFRFLAFVVWVALALPAIGASADPQAGNTLQVFAAASLREAFTEIGKRFESENHVVVRFNFAGADMLANQIVQGAPADVFASANEAWAHFLQDRNELGSAPQIFARNRLIIIVPKSNPAAIRSPRELAKPGVKLILEAPTVPLGKYARDAFKAMSSDSAYGAGFATKVEANVVSNEVDVKAVAAKIAAGEGDAGIVFITDVAPIAVAVSTIAMPIEYTPPAAYPIAVVKGSSAPDLAAKFVAYVLSPAGQAILRESGFLAPPTPVERFAPSPVR